MNYKDGQYRGVGSGYGGSIEIEVEILQNKINDITVVAHNETKIISDPAFEYVIKNIIDKNTILVPNVSGCSMSSRGIREAVKNALIKAGADKEELEALILESENLVKINAKKRTLNSVQNFDVVVVGGGGAGLSAAIAAADNGAKVVLLEKMNNLGGNTLVSMGGVNIPENDEQKENEIIDSKESFYNDILQGGDQESNLDQVDILVQNALDTYRWLKEVVGVEFKPKKIIHFGGHKVPRASVFKGKYAIELISKLKSKALSMGVEILTGLDCKNLICDDNGRIVGVSAITDEKEITFSSEYGVILATGGFSGNVEMRRKYNPKLDDRYKTTNVSGVTGHGHIMSEQVGAKFVHMKYIQTFPISNPNTGELSHVGGSRFDGAILVNKDGKRFVEELERRDVVSENILDQEGQVAYLIWSKEIEEIGSGTTNHKAEVKRLMKDNLFGEFNSIEEGAEFFEIDKDTLRKTLEGYNNYVKNGKDEEFNRRGKLVSISAGPYYIQVVAPAVHHTMGGVKINNKNQVEKEDKTIIHGLYAAGEIVGGTHGTNRLGGNAITEVLVFGKRAGESIVSNK